MSILMRIVCSGRYMDIFLYNKDAKDNTGSGGGGRSGFSPGENSGNGGSGICIIRWRV